MAETIAAHRDRKDSIGGTCVGVIRSCPVGLGEPCFDRIGWCPCISDNRQEANNHLLEIEAMLAHAMLSIPSTKAFEIGSGFGGMRLYLCV